MQTNLVSLKITDENSRNSCELFIPFYEELLNYLRKQNIYGIEPEDIAQETFKKIAGWVNSENVPNPKVTLFKIARNLVIDNHRRKKTISNFNYVVKETQKDQVTNITPETLNSDKEKMRAIMKAVESLPERPKKAFILNRFKKKSYKEISQIMNISISTVEKHISRGILVCKKASDL